MIFSILLTVADNSPQTIAEVCAYVRVPWLIHESRCVHLSSVCDMTHTYVWHDSFICVPWLIHMCAMTHSWVSFCAPLICMWHDSYICVPWLIHMCDMTHPWVSLCTPLICMWHDSYTRDMTRARMTWRIHMCDMTHLNVAWLMYSWRDPCICDDTVLRRDL